MATGWTPFLAVVGATILPASFAVAQAADAPPPHYGRFEATALAGYRLEGSITRESAPETPAVALGNAATYGLALDWRLNPYGDAELQYSFTSSPAVSTSPGDGRVARGFDMGIHDVTLGFVGNATPVGQPVRPYFSVGVGFTVLAPSNELPAQAKLTVAFAAGVRAYFSDHYGLRLEARYTPVYLFSTGPCQWEWFLCTGGSTGHVIQQSDFRLGVTFRF